MERAGIKESDLSIAVIIPTYNERDNIRELAQLILDLPEPISLIVVDDSSPDGTAQVVREMARTDPQIHLIERPGKLGLGTAYLAGFQRAFDLDARWIMTMDADFSHHPRYIPDLLRASREGGYDVVIGSRYIPGGGTRHWHWQRVLFSAGANRIARMGLGLRPNDCTAGFRLYRREVLDSIPLDRIFSNGYSFLLELLYRVQAAGWRIGETPILFADRQRGASKISRREIIKAAYTVLRLRLERVPHYFGQSY